jgi:hypothetical protein
MYINPELYKKELEARGGSSDNWQKVNSEFEHQSRTAKLYGKPELSPELKQALESYRDMSNDQNVPKVGLGNVTSSDINEEEVLG